MSLPSDTDSRKVIKNCLLEISNSLTNIENERNLIKESINIICEKFDLNKRTFRKLSRTFHKQNFFKEVSDHREYEEMYQQLTNETTLDGTL